MEIFKIEVWYRYTSQGEQEKDFETHEIIAGKVQEAINKAKNLYKNLKVMPFAFYHEKIKYQPQI